MRSSVSIALVRFLCFDVKTVSALLSGKYADSDCYDSSDEVCETGRQTLALTTLPPAVLHVDDTGQPFLFWMDSDECPLTHVQCFQGFCLPIYLRCNGVDDCPYREDEISCANLHLFQFLPMLGV